MKITVFVKPGANRVRVEQVDQAHYRVHVGELPRDGKANAAVIRALAGWFGVDEEDISILSGRKSRQKQVGIRGI